MKHLKKWTLVVALALSSSFAFAGNEGGHGGFVDDSARVMLRKTADLLSRNILDYSNEGVIDAYFVKFLGGVPETFDRQKLANIIKNVRFGESEKERYRNGRKLLFDYGVDKKTGEQYIIALPAFFNSYVAWTADQISYQLIESLCEKMLHEVSHFWGYDERQAKFFAESFVVLLAYDSTECPFNNYGGIYENSINMGRTYSESSIYNFNKYIYTSVGGGLELTSPKAQVGVPYGPYYGPLKFSDDHNFSSEVVVKDQQNRFLGSAEIDFHMDPTFLNGTASVTKVKDLEIKVTHFSCFNAGMKGIVNRLNDMTD